MRVEIAASWFVMIWYGSAEIKQRGYKSNLMAKLFLKTTFSLTRAGTHHILCTLRSSFHPCQYVWEFCAEQRYQGQAESPRAK